MDCGKCGRQLKDKLSIERGYGPVCYIKIQKTDEVPEGQLSIDDVQPEKGQE